MSSQCRDDSVPSVFTFRDYREFLRAYYESRKRSNPRFSYRVFAQQAKIRSYTSLKYVIDKRRHVSPALLSHYVSALKLNSQEEEYFRLLWKSSTERNQRERERVLQEVEQFRNGVGEQHLQFRKYIEAAQAYQQTCQFSDCERELRTAYRLALELHDLSTAAETLTRLIRTAADLRQVDKISRYEKDLEFLEDLAVATNPVAMLSYCRGMLAFIHKDFRKAQGHFVRFLKKARQELQGLPPARAESLENSIFRAWVTLTVVSLELGRMGRAKRLAKTLLEEGGSCCAPDCFAILQMALGKSYEHFGDLTLAQLHYENSHANFLKAKNWFGYLYALLAYARVSRLKGDRAKMEVYLELVEKTVPKEFTSFREVLAEERCRMNQASQAGTDSAEEACLVSAGSA